jgi:hypothetical protein
MADSSTSKPTRIGDANAGEIIGAFLTDDDLVEHSRARAGRVGLSYDVLAAITGLGEGRQAGARRRSEAGRRGVADVGAPE